MSRTWHTTIIPLSEGITKVLMPSTANSGSDAQVVGTSIEFVVYPDWIGAVLVRRRVLMQPSRKKIPAGFKGVGKVQLKGKSMNVLVEFL